MKLGNLLVGLFMITAIVGCSKKPEKEVVLNAVPTVTNEMPAFTATKTDNSTVFFKDLKGKTLLVLFNPDCDHCQREAKLISENKEILDGYEVYFITVEQMPAIIQFQKDYKLEAPNIHFGRADGPAVIGAVGQVSEVPTMFVYDNQKLKARVQGEVGLERIKQLLK